MAIGLIIIGDEILSGKRQDRHFAGVRAILARRKLALAWVYYLGDDRPLIRATLARTFATDDIVFCTGGIGATPDDHTRQAAAEALGLDLVLHPEAARLITERAQAAGLPVTPERLRMGEFPRGAQIIPNPYNRIPGFSLHRHHFLPGFPEMAWPMLEWVLDVHYGGRLQGEQQAEASMIVRGLAEATLTPLMEAVERDYPGVRVFSLPRLDPRGPHGYEIELGVKGNPAALDQAMQVLREGALALGGEIDQENAK